MDPSPMSATGGDSGGEDEIVHEQRPSSTVPAPPVSLKNNFPAASFSPFSLITRLDGEAFTYIGKPFDLGIKPGATPSVGMFTHNCKRYYGKGAVTDDRQYAVREALQEVLANGLYRHFGCHAQQLILFEQQWLPGSEMFSNDVSASFGLHLMSEWIDGFTPFGPFVAQQLLCAVWPPPSDVFVVGDKRVLPVRGLGQIIAVGMLLNDTDCIGGTGGNVGYTVITDADTNSPLYVQAIKIDPGQSFRLSRKDETQSQSRYSTLLTSSLDAIRRGRAHVNPQHAFHVKGLPVCTEAEFMECVSSIASHPMDDMRGVLTSPGLEPLFPADSDVSRLLDFLETRRSALTSTFHAVETSVHPPQSSSVQSLQCLHAIKSGYTRTVALIDPVTGVRYPIDDRFVNLCLLDKEELQADSGSESVQAREQAGLVGGRAVPRSSFEVMRVKKASIAVEDIFLRCTGPTKRVNVSGAAGIGKSTCCQSIVSRWAAGRLFTQFDLVVWVPLRRLTSSRYPSGDRYTVIDVIIEECLGVHPSPQLRKCVAALYNPDTTLWILDGYDEIVGRVPTQLACALDDILSAPNRILTGRLGPHAMSGLTGVLEGDVDIEVAGFTDANIQEFVNKFASQADSVDGSALLQSLRQSGLVWNLAHIPVNLPVVLLCHVFSVTGPVLGDVSLTELYSRVEMLMGQRYCVKLGEDVTALTSHRLSELVTPMFDWLSEIAYQAIKAGMVIIPGSFISNLLSERDRTCDLDGAVWPALKLSGLLVQVDGASDDPLAATFHFLHLTLQEYFAAKRVAAGLCGDAPLATVEMDWLRTHKYGFHLEVMWWFVGGLLGFLAHSGGILALAELWTAQPRDIGRVFEARVWLRMIEEGRLWQLPDSVKPEIVDEVISMSKPYVIESDGVPVPRWKSSAFADMPPRCILEALAACPRLCRDAILPSDTIAALDRLYLTVDSQCNSLNMLGSAVLRCGAVWGIVKDGLLRKRFYSFSRLLPDILDYTEFFTTLRECTLLAAVNPFILYKQASSVWDMIGAGKGKPAVPAAEPVVLSHPGLTLPKLLEVNSAAVVQWLQALFHVDSQDTSADPLSRRREWNPILDLGCRLLIRIGVESLLRCEGVADCVCGALYGASDKARELAVHLLRSLGPKLLDTQWAVDWCTAALISGRVDSMKLALKLFTTVGEKGLSCDSLLVAVQDRLSTSPDRFEGCLEASDVVCSMLPFVIKCGRESLLDTWLATIMSHDWNASYIQKLITLFRLFPLPLVDIPVVMDALKRWCALKKPYPVDADAGTLPLALLVATGPPLLQCAWYLDWLTRAARESALIRPALTTLRGMPGSAVLACAAAMALLKRAVSWNDPGPYIVKMSSPIISTIAELAKDPAFRQDPRVVTWLRALIFDGSTDLFGSMRGTARAVYFDRGR